MVKAPEAQALSVLTLISEGVLSLGGNIVGDIVTKSSDVSAY